tara:strand:- start:47 stop:766 length:720 start_codon:yes stop_codon:yes gene_type:complete
MQSMKNIKIWIALFYLLILTVFLYFLFSKFNIGEVTTYDFIKSNREHLFSFKDQNFVLVFFYCVIIGILWILLQGFGSPLVIAAGFLFGPYLGTVIGLISMSIGATLIYSLANFFFKDFIKEKFLKRFKNLESRFRNKELTYMIIYRVIGGTPLQLQNLIPCMFSVRVKNYFIGSFVGFIPQIFIMANLGSGLEKQIEKNTELPSFAQLITSYEIYMPILGFLLLLLLVFIIKNFYYKN